MPQHPTAPSSVLAAPSRTLLGRAQLESARGRGGLHAPRVWLQGEPGEGALQGLLGGLGQPLPRTADSPQSDPKRPRGHPQPFPRDGTLSHSFLRATPAPGRSIPFRENSELLTGPHSRQFDAPVEPTHRPSSALGRSPSRSPTLRTKMSGRVTGQPPPGPTPGAGRTRCLCPGAAPRPRTRSADAGRRRPERVPFHLGLTVSSAAAAGRQGTGRGRHNMAENRSCSRQLPAAASGKTRPRASSSCCGAGRGSTTSPPLPAGFLPLPPPFPPLPWQRGAKEISPAPPRFPPPVASLEESSARPFPPLPPQLKGRARTRRRPRRAGRGSRGLRRPEGRGSH